MEVYRRTTNGWFNLRTGAIIPFDPVNDLPDGPGFVSWESLHQTGDTIQQTLNRAGTP